MLSQEELIRRELQIEKDKEGISRQREELIQKSNLILEQVNGLRAQKEKLAQQTLAAEKLKKTAEEQIEQAENRQMEFSLKENELLLREKKLAFIDDKEKQLKQREITFEIEKDILENAIREKEKQDFIAKQKRIPSNI